jgi:hypothetical protein
VSKAPKTHNRSSVSHGVHYGRDRKPKALRKREQNKKRREAALEEAREHEKQMDSLVALGRPETRDQENPPAGRHPRCSSEMCVWFDPHCPKKRNISGEKTEAPSPAEDKEIHLPLYHKPPKMALDAKTDNVRDRTHGIRMIEHGYHVYHVMRVTGWGFDWWKDMIGPDGYRLEATDNDDRQGLSAQSRAHERWGTSSAARQ